MFRSTFQYIKDGKRVRIRFKKGIIKKIRFKGLEDAPPYFVQFLIDLNNIDKERPYCCVFTLGKGSDRWIYEETVGKLTDWMHFHESSKDSHNTIVVYDQDCIEKEQLNHIKDIIELPEPEFTMEFGRYLKYPECCIQKFTELTHGGFEPMDWIRHIWNVVPKNDIMGFEFQRISESGLRMSLYPGYTGYIPCGNCQIKTVKDIFNIKEIYINSILNRIEDDDMAIMFINGKKGRRAILLVHEGYRIFKSLEELEANIYVKEK